MKKFYLLFFLLCFANLVQAQYTETFEDETQNSTSFTSNGQVFNISSQTTAVFDIQSFYTGTGWNGTSIDNRYIDNSGSAAFNTPVQFTISTANGAGFNLKSVWLFLSSNNLVLNAGGTMTITGKLGGVDKFQVSGSSFNTTASVNNGFTFFNMASYGGQDNSNVIIDQYVITTTGNLGYVSLDAMTWTGACLAPTVIPVSQSNISCYGGSNGAATVSASGIGLTYDWSPGNATGDGTAAVTGLTAGTWTCTVTTGCGLSSTSSFTITQPAAPVTATQSQTNVSCNGGANGTATVVTSGGTPGYTYLWSPSGGTNATASNLLAGNYTVTITDTKGCSIQKNFSISQPAALAATQGQTNVSCSGGTNGAASVSVSGGTGGYTYSWSPSGGTGATATNLVAGNYTVTITDANNCSIQKNFQITQLTALSGATAQNDVTCFGGSNGSATVAVSGGAGGYTYSWAPYGGTYPTAAGLIAGNYTVTVTDANSCQITKSFTINQPSAPVSGSKVIYNVSCFGGNNGAINLTPSGGTSPYTFNWGGGVTTEDRTGLAAGNYSVTITDNNGCTGTVAVTVGQPAGPVSGTTVVSNVACFGGSNGSINLTPSGGTAPYTFNWGGGIHTEDRTDLFAGSYTVTITDINGCSTSVNTAVGQPSAPVSGTTVVTNVSCFGGSTGSINFTPSGGTGPYTFYWIGSGITTEDRTDLSAGDYTVIVTDYNGCTATATATISQPSAPVSGSTVVYNVSCYGGSNGAINFTPSGGTGPYTFNWGGGISYEDRTGLSAGDYTVIVTDNNGCTATVTATVSQPAAPVSGSGVVTDVACFGGSGGSIDLTASGGTGPYTFDWGGGIFTEDRTDLTAGDYSVNITDSYGCTGTVTVTVNQPGSVVSVSADVTNVSCFSGSNGTINLTPSGGTGPYSYDWGSGIITEDRTGLQAGDYTVVITSITGCTSTLSITVTQPIFEVTGTTEVTNVQCYGSSNGSINLTPFGGTAPYTYNWGGGMTTQDRTGLTAGSYTVLITDSNGCTGTVSVAVGGPLSPLSASALVTNVSCFGGTDGAINITASGGTGPYGFYWLGNVFTQNRTGLLPGNYTVFILDSNGCVEAVTATVAQPDPLSASAIVTNVSCFAASDGTADITVSGGTGPYTYDWGNGITTEDRTGLDPGSYSVAITDTNGCMTTVNTTITEPPELTLVTATQTNVTCFGEANGSATVAVTGGTGSYTYSWSPSGGTGATGSVLAEGNNIVTITDENGCQITQSFNIIHDTIQTYYEVCAGTTVADVTNEESNLNWYATTTGTPLTATKKLITGTYYVAKPDCPVSSRIAVNVVITCTSVVPSICGITLASISSDVAATPVPAATAYRFMVSDGTDTEVVETTLSKFKLTNLVIGSYNTTYTVEVAILLDGEWRNYGQPCTISTGEPLTTKISDTFCNAEVSLRTTITANTVPYATLYRFRVLLDGVEQIIETPAKSFTLSMLQWYDYDATYIIDVAAMIDGSFTDYGTSCSVYVPAAYTSIKEQFCNSNVDPNTTLYADKVLLATQYRFKINNGVSATLIDRPVNSMRLSLLPYFSYGTSYTIEVAVMIDGVFTPYGPECTVHVPATSTSLEDAYCGAQVSPTASIFAYSVPLATHYRFRVTDGITTSTLDRPSRYMKMTMLAEYNHGVNYTIEVAAMVNGVFSDYGDACQVTTTSSTARFAQEGAQSDADDERATIGQEVSAYPNPYSDVFMISLQTASLEKVTIQVFEITGKLVENLSLNPEQLNLLKIGNSYASGFYNVIVTQGSYQKTLKMIKN